MKFNAIAKGALAAAAVSALGAAPANATIAGDTFTVDTQIIGLQLAGQPLVDVSVQQSGVALSAPNPDVVLAQVAADLTVLSIDLGVLGVEWIDDDTFDLVMGLEALLDLGLVQVPVALNVVPTINWVLSDLDFGPPQMKITSVVQVDQDFDELIGSGISFTDDSISIATNSLVAAGAAINGGNSLDATVRFDVTTEVVPLPGSIWMMAAGGLGAMGYLGRKRKRA